MTDPARTPELGRKCPSGSSGPPPVELGQEDQMSQLRHYLDTVFGDSVGYAVMAWEYQRRNQSWRERPYAWPDEADQLVSDLLNRATSGADVYVCPNILRGKERVMGSAVDRSLVHSDVDDPGLDASKVVALGGFAVWSGTPGHAHAYVRLDRAVSVEEHERLCLALRRLLGAKDPKKRDNDVLRPPGTLNFKGASSAGADVSWAVPPSGTTRSPEELARLLGLPPTQGGATPTTGNDRVTRSGTYTLTDEGGGLYVPPVRSSSPRTGHHAEGAPQLAHPGLSGEWRAVLKSGVVPDRFDGDRSRAAMALITACVNAGWPMAQVERELCDPTNGASIWYSHRRDGTRRTDGRSRIQQDYAKATEYVVAHPPFQGPDDARAVIQGFSRLSARLRWPGRTGPADRVVLAAVHAMAINSGKLRLALSVREVAERGGVSRGTAARSLKRLSSVGWLRRVAKADLGAGTAAVYQLMAPNADPDGLIDEVRVPRDRASDARRGMGATQAHIFDALDETPRSIKHLAERTGRHRRTVSRHLGQLHRDGLAQRLENGMWLRGSRTPEDLLADFPQWIGQGERQKDSHHREREAQRLAREQYEQDDRAASAKWWRREDQAVEGGVLGQ